MFGKESAGIPEEILKEHKDTCVRIPMLGETRSLNLSNAAAIVIYEALRQHGFAGLTTEGELHIHPWSYYE
jgi:tRNA (cytidine/uridine-2'-O-)-methyltransferase